MTAVNPPTYVVSTYNPAFFETTTTGLTQGQANTLYLKKTVPDTSAVLETFTGGISTSLINASSTTSDFALVPVLTGNMGIGTVAPSGTAVKTIQLGETTVTSVHAGGIDCTGPSINGAVAPLIGTLSLGGSQTTGIINIGTNSTRGGIGTSGQINIGNLSNTGFTMNIGSPLTSMYLRGLLSIGTSDGNISIGSANSGSSGVSIGNLTNAVTIGGALNVTSGIFTSALDYALSGGTLAIGNVNATGINIGNAITTGTMAICGSASRTATLYLGAGTGASGPVQIGGSASNVTVNNALIVTNGLSVGGPITLGTVPSTSAHLGYVFGGDIGGSTPVASGSVVSSITIAQTGTFIFAWYYQQYFPTTAPTQPTMSFSGYGGSEGFVTVSSTYNECNGTAIISRTTSTSTTYNLIFNYTSAGSMSSYQGFYKAIRVG